VTSQLPLFTLQDRATPGPSAPVTCAALVVRVYPAAESKLLAPHGASPAVVQRFIASIVAGIDERVRDFAALPVSLKTSCLSASIFRRSVSAIR